MTKYELLYYLAGMSGFIFFLAVYCIDIDQPDIKHPFDDKFKGPVD